MGCDNMKFIDVTKVEGCCYSCDPWVSLCAGNLLPSWTIISVSRRTLLLEVCHFFYRDRRTYENFDAL